MRQRRRISVRDWRLVFLRISYSKDNSRFPRILLISPIAEMEDGFAKTFIIEMGADGASEIRVAE